MPAILWMVRMREEYPGRLPSEIQAEWMRQPAGYLEELLEATAFKEAYRIHQEATTSEARARLTSPVFQLIDEFEFAEAQQQMDQAKD